MGQVAETWQGRAAWGRLLSLGRVGSLGQVVETWQGRAAWGRLLSLHLPNL